ncbi:MAG: HAMP domain-containing protein [Acidimicrobiia bacterium]|nr:HAMP domain-containing protein [Acidimicrobiia bacterium]MYC57053.1 HAMP domain-containing protein [Acidimicrobiia bacterium]MYG93660.1 HAMP domain-containing protein [Acidimicrobiia bacterium]MYI30130.1 HAMP domain-containing protein [Acidimicrobiia bacterium]
MNNTASSNRPQQSNESAAPQKSTKGSGKPALHRRISTQLYSGIFGAVALTIVASVVSWLSFNNVDQNQKRVSNESVPELTGAFSLAKFSNALVVAVPRLTTSSPSQFSTISTEVTAAQSEFQQHLDPLLAERPNDPNVQGITQAADALTQNIATITANMPFFFGFSRQVDQLKSQIAARQDKVQTIIIPAIDDQLFFQVTGYRDFDTEPANMMFRTAGDQLLIFRHLNTLQADVAQVTELMGSALIASDAEFVEPLIESFESAANRIEISLQAIADSEIAPGLDAAVDELLELGRSNNSVFNVTVQRLKIIENHDQLLGDNQALAVDLIADVNALVQRAEADAAKATASSEQSISQARTLLVIIMVIGVIVAGLISWLFIGRVLLRRIGHLSDRMRSLASGDLEEEVEVVGRDEIAQMASALELFRRNALEVQRLNLVEQLAQELSERNNELQEVLAELGQAQDQIVAREKLAALGEVTAGVAHEIRNPLNFINNFSAASAELLEELAEVYENLQDHLSDEQKSLITEINQDLNDNLERIQSHGKRANRIVQDMLMMGRGGGETQMVDINDLMHEHSLLAYHSARAQDPEFQVLLEEDYDPEMGQLEVVPQDLGRVFLNFVANSGYAANKKQKQLMEQNNLGEYVPTVWLKTKRCENKAILTVRDNGVGIPPDVASKIFDPFFTTKPTNEGTGLGLALASDIVREHGGSISLDTEPGEFTEMVVELPLVRSTSGAVEPQADESEG